MQVDVGFSSGFYGRLIQKRPKTDLHQLSGGEVGGVGDEWGMSPGDGLQLKIKSSP